MSIQPKLKTCASCNKAKHIWKIQGRDRYCKECWYSMEKPKSISPVSKKRQVEMDEYSKKRTAYLALHPICEARLQGCLGASSEIHHLYSGKDRHKYYLNMSTWKAVCRNCHIYTHDHLSMEQAIKLNLKLIE
jgi:AMMECR1 domain-containing protein